MFFSPAFSPVNSISIAQTDSFSNAANQASYTASGMSLGPENTSRTIYVLGYCGVTSGNVRDVTAITINGVSVNITDQYFSSKASPSEAESFLFQAWAHVPTGTSGDVVVTLNNTVNNCVLFIMSVLYQPVPGDSGGSSSFNSGTGTSLNDAINNVNPGAFCFGLVRKANTNTTTIGGDFTKLEEIAIESGSVTAGICPVSTVPTENKDFNTSWSGSVAAFCLVMEYDKPTV